MEILKLKSTGDNVKRLQKFLGITADGSFGAKTEKAVKEWQKDNGIEADGIVGKKTWELMFPSSPSLGGEVVYNPIQTHITPAKGRKIKYLVIHYTAGTSSAGDAETKVRNVFLSRQASADFVVDDDTMLQVNPDPENYFCWAVGDGKGKKGIYNKDCISIEMCSNLKKGTTAKVPNHEGWYFTQATIDNAVKLAKLIMKRYNIPLERVITHFTATSKACPGCIGWNTGQMFDSITGKPIKKYNNESEWIKFKERLKDV